MKTLKYEEVYRNEYRDFTARASIGEFLGASTIRSDSIRLSDTFRQPGLKAVPHNGSAGQQRCLRPRFNAVAPEW